MTPPGVTVIVPARGSAPGLESCLVALQMQTLPPQEVVVVDNGLEGGLTRIREATPEVVVVQEEGEGSYRARNAGLRNASAPVVAFTDADCIPDPEWLAEAVELLSAGESRIVAGAVEVTASDRESRSPAEVLELTLAFPQERYVQRQGFGVTANLVAFREVFQEVGPFREDLRSGGDFEWGRRAAAGGIRTAYAPGARVRHPARRTARELEEKEIRVARGIGQLLRAGDYGWGRFVRLVLWSLSPPLLSGWTILGDPGLGSLGLRLRAMGLLFRLRWIRLRTLLGSLKGGAG